VLRILYTVPMDLFSASSEGSVTEAELLRVARATEEHVEEFPVWLAPAGGLR